MVLVLTPLWVALLPEADPALRDQVVLQVNSLVSLDSLVLVV